MITFTSIRRFCYNGIIRKRTVPLLVLLLFILLYQISRADITRPELVEINLLQTRNKISNPVYDTQKLVAEDDMASKCKLYFETLGNLEKSKDYFAFRNSFDSRKTDRMIAWNTFPYTNLVFKKNRFLRERKRELKLKLSAEGLKISKAHENRIANEYIQQLQLTSMYETKLIHDVSNMRIWGKCFLSENFEAKPHSQAQKHLDHSCIKYQERLLPWISGYYPVFQSWEKSELPQGKIPVYDKAKYDRSAPSECFVKQFKNRSNGKGIVIPLLHLESKIFDNVIRLITVLRGLKNKLPIQILYLGEGLDEYHKMQLVKAARHQGRKPHSSERMLKSGPPVPTGSNTAQYAGHDFPQQDVWFVQMDRALNVEEFSTSELLSSADFTYSLSTILNSFEEFVLLTPQNIPLSDNFEADFFLTEKYQKYGITLFKGPTQYNNKPARFEPGFHEISSLVKNQLMPSKLDANYFDISQRQINVGTRRIFEQNFFKMVDPNLMVINKSKVLSGLILGNNLLMQKSFRTRFYNKPDTSYAQQELNTEFMWLGQEMAGTNELTNFNHNFAVTAGVLTPRINLPQKSVTMALEICSSSWGQVSEEDSTKILYITSHQLENWRDGDQRFRSSLKRKYSVETSQSALKTEKDYIETLDTSFYDLVLTKNPMFIESVMKPPTIDEPKYETELREPNEAWILQEGFGESSSYEYWCTYDIVGNPLTGIRGLTVELNKDLQARYNYILDLWMGGESRSFY